MHIVLLILKRPWACLHWNTKFHPQASLPWGGLVNSNVSWFIKYWNNSNTHIKTTRKRQRFKKKCQSKQGLEVNFLQVDVIWYKSYWKYYYQLELPSLSSTNATWGLLGNKMGGGGVALQSKIMVVIKTMKSLSSSKAHWKWFFLYLWAVLYNPKYHKYHSTSLLLCPPWVWEKTGEDMKTKKADWKYYKILRL